MSSNDQKGSEAENDATVPTDDAHERGTKRKDVGPKKPSLSLNRKLNVFVCSLLLIAVIALTAGGTYPYWRNEARTGLGFFNVSIGKLEHSIGIPQWIIDHGRDLDRINGQHTLKVAASEETSLIETKKETPDRINGKKKPPPPSLTSSGIAAKVSRQGPLRQAAMKPAAVDKEGQLRAKVDALAYKVREFEVWVLRLEEQLAGIDSKITELEKTFRLSTRSGVGGQGEQIVELSEQVAVLESAVAEMRTRNDQQEPNSAPGAMITAMVSLAERIGTIESQARTDKDSLGAIRNETSAVGSRLNALNEQVTALNAVIERDNPAREQASLLLLSVNQLVITATRGDPFISQLESIRAIAHGAIDLDHAFGRLDPHAAKGAATLVTLRSQFATVAMTAVRTRNAGTRNSLVGKTLSRVASLVTIRKVEAPAPNSLDSALAAADAALAAGDLSAAVSALRGLDGAIGVAVEPWLSNASDRLAVNEGIADLQAAALAALSAAG